MSAMMADNEYLTRESSRMEDGVQAQDENKTSTVMTSNNNPTAYKAAAVDNVPPYGYSPQGSFKFRSVYGIGITQIVLALVCIIFQTVACVMGDYIASGIWSGLFFIITGTFGVGAKSGMRCLVTASMILNILSAALIAPVFMGLSVVLLINSTNCYYYCEDFLPVAYGTMLVLGLALMIISIISASFCCLVVCYPVSTNQTMYYSTGGQAKGYPPQVYYNQVQPIVIPIVQPYGGQPVPVLMNGQPQPGAANQKQTP